MMSRKILSGFVIAFFIGGVILSACKKNGDDPNSDIPYAHINVVINPNSTLYQEISFVGGWMYYPYVNTPSRGLIIYRWTLDQFMAYERTPPVNSNACCNPQTGRCTHLIVKGDELLVHDTCSDYYYQLFDGSPISPATVPLKQYNTAYDGLNLYITN